MLVVEGTEMAYCLYEGDYQGVLECGISMAFDFWSFGVYSGAKEAIQEIGKNGANAAAAAATGEIVLINSSK